MTATLAVRTVASLAEIAPEAWDACANPPGLTAEAMEGERFNPFVAHAFLRALEESGSVGGRTGWTPAHVLVEDDNGRLVAAAPTYLKTHSQGEYVFDHGWADAYERAGGRYYPKVQIAAPFTPVTGRRLLVAADAPDGAAQALIAGWRALARGGRRVVGPCHFLRPSGLGALAARRVRAAHRRAVSFRQPGLRRLRRLPRRPRLAQAQGDQARTARRAGRRHSGRTADRRRDRSRNIGRRSSPSTWTPARANGAAPI